jgi:DNA polymerase (family 10)
MHNADVIRVLAEMADLLDIEGGNPFRIRAFRNAIELLENFPVDLGQHLKEGHALEELQGIGKGLARDIREILETGDCGAHRELLKKFPASLLSLLRVPGLGPKKVRRLFDELGVEALDRLEEACRSHKVRALAGFGAATEEKFLKGLLHAKTTAGRFLLSEAEAVARALVSHLRNVKGAERIETAGSLRRRKETIGDLDILVTGRAALAPMVMDAFVRYPRVEEVLARGDTKSSVRLRGGMQADLRFLEPAEFGAAWQYFTGSKEHNVALRQRAKQRGLKLSEYGVFRDRDEKRVAGATEEEVYGALDLAWIPPELRENRGEIREAEKGRIPALVELADLRGDLHSHTVETDGSATIEEMAEAAQKRGLEYLAITDHSKAVTVARGMDERRLLRQIEAVRRAQEGFKKIRLLAGVEVDILKDGSLDLRDDALARCDFVVASVHFALSMGESEMTKRIVKAMRSPHVDAVGHPTGRLITGREGYAVNLRALIEAAVETETFLELNAYPMRLDLGAAALREAKAAGAGVVLSTDSHDTRDFENARYGVATARRGWLTKRDIVNALAWRDFYKALKARKEKSTPGWQHGPSP